jgi:prevent-host-death family protein
MQQVGVSELRSNLTGFLRKVQRGQEIGITSRGRVIARLAPPSNSMKRARNALSVLRETARVGDVLSPVEAAWKAHK